MKPSHSEYSKPKHSTAMYAQRLIYVGTGVYFFAAVALGMLMFRMFSLSSDTTRLTGIGLFEIILLFELLLGMALLSYLLAKRTSGEQVVIQQVTESGNIQTLQQEIDALDVFKKLEQETLLAVDHILLDKALTETDKISKVLSKVCEALSSGQGVVYKTIQGTPRLIRMQAAYALQLPESKVLEFEFGEGLAGQCAKMQKPMLVADVTEHPTRIQSGLGRALPRHLILCPILYGHECLGVIELGSFTLFDAEHERLLKEVAIKLSEPLNTLRQ